jgi:uncharacterized membrane protein
VSDQAALSGEAVTTASPPLNRMAIALLALVGVLISVYLTLHKFGVIGTLVCGEGSCDTVQASPWAVFIGVPVPLIGLLGYGVLLAIALLGLQPDRAASRPIALLLFVLADLAFVFTAYLTYLEAFVINAWCRWCIASAVLVTLIWIFSLPEVLKLRRTA